MHHIEHLAPLCHFLEIPLVVFTERDAATVQRYYPAVATLVVPFETDDHVEMLLRARDAGLLQGRTVLYSNLFSQRNLDRLFHSSLAPSRIAYCAHGFSEKKQSWAAAASWHDICIVEGALGAHHVLSLTNGETGCRFVLSGNYRKHYFETYKKTLSERIEPLFSRLRESVLVLYTPTWQDGIGSSSLINALDTFLERIPKGVCLGIKPHPLISRDNRSLSRLQEIDGARHDVIVLVEPAPIYCYLDRSAAIVADMSSIAYDYLCYDRPMIFLNQTAGTAADHSSTRLFRCGHVLQQGQYGQALEKLASGRNLDHQYSLARRVLDSDVHLSPFNEEQFRRDLISALER